MDGLGRDAGELRGAAVVGLEHRFGPFPGRRALFGPRRELLEGELVDQLDVVEIALVALAEEVAGHAPAGPLIGLRTDEAAEPRGGGDRLLGQEAADRVRRDAVVLVLDLLPDRKRVV